MCRITEGFNKYIGMDFDTTKSGKCFVVDYKGNRKVTVMFYDGYVKEVSLRELKSGQVRNPFSSGFLVKGVGICDIYTKESGKDDKEYRLWCGILERCYCEKFHAKKPTYIGCTIHDDWKLYSNFKQDITDIPNFDKSITCGWALDKDILQKGNKVYSKDTCCFVPTQINSLLISNKKVRGDLPIGVQKVERNNKFAACISRYDKNITLSVHDCHIEAFLAYKQAKEEYIKEIAHKWKDQIDPRVYQALMNYEVEVGD